MDSKILMVIILVFSLVACSNNGEATKNNNTNNNVINVKNQVPSSSDKQSAKEIAKNLVNLASSVENVNDATAVVVGNIAVVGIDVNSKIDRSRVGTIKYTVAEALKHDPHGANAIVIADPDATVRLRAMAKEVQQGRPVSGIMNELSAMIGRLMPELPADIFETAPKNPTNSSDEQLQKGEKNKLEKEQQDQSKGNMNNRENPKVPSVDQ